MKEEYSREHILEQQIFAMSILTTILVILLVLSVILNAQLSTVARKHNEEKSCDVSLEEIEEYEDLIVESKYSGDVFVQRDITVTNYYVGDGSSTHKTGSGLTTKDFQINDKGWYTYKGKIVVAAATYEGLKDTFGVLKNYMNEEKGITYYNYGDTFNVVIDKVSYECIVLDTCGASMNIEYLNKYDNGKNRIDIFISDKAKRFGKLNGFILEETKFF